MQRRYNRDILPPVNGSAYNVGGSGNINSNYQYNAYRPPKLRSLNSKHANQYNDVNSGVAGERIRIRQHNPSYQVGRDRAEVINR